MQSNRGMLSDGNGDDDDSDNGDYNDNNEVQIIVNFYSIQYNRSWVRLGGG